METNTLIDLGNVLAIILSIVSLIVTVIGFFASLKFYNDGVKLQNSANDALTRIEEKSLSIQSQVGGMFDKTLDAAIGKKENINNSFQSLTEQLEIAAKAIVDNAQKKIGASGDEERKKLSAIVDKQMEILKSAIEATREKAVTISESEVTSDNSIVGASIAVTRILLQAKEPLSVLSIAKQADLKPILTAQIVNRLTDNGFVLRENINGLPHYSYKNK